MPDRPIPPRRTVPLVLAAFAACAALLFAAAAPSAADPRWRVVAGGAQVSVVPMAYADCPTNGACLWENANYTGIMARLTVSNTSISDLASVNLNNAMTSWTNRNTNRDARWFYNTGLSGTTRCMNPGAGTTNVGATDNDQASSFALYSDAAACT